MIINNNVQAIAGAYQVNSLPRAQRSYDSSAATVRDEVALSSDGVAFSQMLQELQGMDDVREDKVAAVSQAIDDGTYAPKSADVAQKMLGMLY